MMLTNVDRDGDDDYDSDDDGNDHYESLREHRNGHDDDDVATTFSDCVLLLALMMLGHYGRWRQRW